jgi:hypothetical protein
MLYPTLDERKPTTPAIGIQPAPRPTRRAATENPGRRFDSPRR